MEPHVSASNRRPGLPFRSWMVGWALMAMGALWSGGHADEPPSDRGPAPTPAGEIDRLVVADLVRLGLKPAGLCADPVFVRRAYLDVIGTLPTAAEVRAFLADPAADKRSLLVDRLLARPEFADYWTSKWCDLLRVKAEFPINLWPNAVQAYHRWIDTRVRENQPYNRFVYELLTASGSNFRDGPVNFFRAMPNRDPGGIARAVALTFMGTRAERWPAARLAGLAGFFGEVGSKPTSTWKEEIVFHDAARATNGLAATAVFPDGTPARIAAGQDPRVVLADWLVAPGNPWFARAMANRVWAWLLGRGIVHEADDLRPDNPPANPELLAWLERTFVASGYDVRQLFRLILTSQTYQRSSVPESDDPRAATHFAHYALRRLEAEVLVDALNQITGTTEAYSSPIPEPFTVMPEDQRAVNLADGSLTSPMLELFGRPPRDTGLESERNNQPNAAQRLELLNSSHIQRKLERGPKLRPLLAACGRNQRDGVRGLYLTILSRPPTPGEWDAVAAYFRSSGIPGRDATVDLAWALINTAEFQYRH